MLNKDLELTLNTAFREARTRRHEFMTVEHLLLALLDNPSAGEALNACGVDVEGCYGHTCECRCEHSHSVLNRWKRLWQR